MGHKSGNRFFLDFNVVVLRNFYLYMTTER